MKREDTPWERCIITQLLQDMTYRGPRKPVKLTWVDWAAPVALFAFLGALVVFMHYFPNGIWSL